MLPYSAFEEMLQRQYYVSCKENMEEKKLLSTIRLLSDSTIVWEVEL